MKYRVIITDDVYQALSDILEYYRTAPYFSTGERRVKKLLKMMNSLDEMPDRFPLMTGEPWKSMGFRHVTVEEHTLFYTIDENEMTVTVNTLLHARSDFEKRLGGIK